MRNDLEILYGVIKSQENVIDTKMISKEVIKKIISYAIECIEKEKCLKGYRELIYDYLNEKISYAEGVEIGLLNLNNILSDKYDL